MPYVAIEHIDVVSETSWPFGCRENSRLIIDEAPMNDRLQMQQTENVYISMQQDYEIHYWAMELGVTEEQLRHAVNAAGDRLDDIRRHLNR